MNSFNRWIYWASAIFTLSHHSPTFCTETHTTVPHTQLCIFIKSCFGITAPCSNMYIHNSSWWQCGWHSFCLLSPFPGCPVEGAHFLLNPALRPLRTCPPWTSASNPNVPLPSTCPQQLPLLCSTSRSALQWATPTPLDPALHKYNRPTGGRSSPKPPVTLTRTSCSGL